MARRGAMTKNPPVRGEQRKQLQAQNRSQQNDPSANKQAQGAENKGASKWTRTGVGTYKDQYGNVLKGQKQAPKKDMSRRTRQPPAPPTPQPPTPEQVTETGFIGAGGAYEDLINRYRETDPMDIQQQYEPVYSQEMERARQNVLSQFERRNAEEFERQNLETQRQIVERGLDPNSPAAQALMKQNTQRQDLARQEAMSAAEQAASGLQQQMYGQAMGVGMMPYEQWQAIQAPYVTGIGAQYQQQQLTQQQEFEARQNRLNRQAQERIARMSRGGGGGGGQTGPTLYERMQANALGQGYGQQQPNPWAGVASGFAQGVGAGITQGLMRGGS